MSASPQIESIERPRPLAKPDDLVSTVSAVLPSTPHTRILRLDLGGTPFSYAAGQAAKIGLAERHERVPYSIASAPAETGTTGVLEFLIKVEDSGRWGHTFDTVAPGDRIGIRGPIGTFQFPSNPEEERFLFIAGGTGIAPIRAMIREALLTGHASRIKLLYSAKRAADLAFLDELGELAHNHSLDLRLHVTRETHEEPDPSTKPRIPLGLPKVEHGRIGLNEIAPLVEDPATLCFVCGPESMVAEVPRMLHELGIERARIKIEEW